ncbi:MAG: ATP-binding protein [Anaerolineae bacterium]
MSNALANRVIGHEWATDLLGRGLANGRIPQALLITGPPNVGKTTLAIALAQTLNCTGEVAPCTECLSCRKIEGGHHPDVQVLDDAEAALRIDQIRSLQRDLSLSPHEGRYRVAILCNFERATLEAANALLKTLEEPASPVVLILTALEPGHLLPTIVSRCQGLSLRPLPVSQIAGVLVTRWGVPEAQAALLSQLSAGRLGWAIRAIEDETLLARRKERLADIVSLLGSNRTERLSYAQELGQDAALTREALNLWASWWRDVLLLSSGSPAPISNRDWLNVLHWLSERLSVAQVLLVVQKICGALANLDRNVNSRLNLEVALLSLPYVRETPPTSDAVVQK